MRVSAITEIQRVNRINRVILEVFGSLKVFFDGSCQSRSATCKMTGFRRDVEREMSSTRVCLKIRYSQISYNTIISPFQMAHNFQTPKKISNRIFFWKDICEDQLILSMAIDLGGKPIHFGPRFFFSVSYNSMKSKSQVAVERNSAWSLFEFPIFGSLCN